MNSSDLFQLVIGGIAIMFGISALVWLAKNKDKLAKGASLAHTNRVLAEKNDESARSLLEELKRRAA